MKYWVVTYYDNPLTCPVYSAKTKEEAETWVRRQKGVSPYDYEIHEVTTVNGTEHV